MDSAIVSSVLQRYGEWDGWFYERRIPTDLERQILNRIQEIYDNPNKIEQDAQKVRVENSEFANELNTDNCKNLSRVGSPTQSKSYDRVIQ